MSVASGAAPAEFFEVAFNKDVLAQGQIVA